MNSNAIGIFINIFKCNYIELLRRFITVDVYYTIDLIEKSKHLV